MTRQAFFIVRELRRTARDAVAWHAGSGGQFAAHFSWPAGTGERLASHFTVCVEPGEPSASSGDVKNPWRDRKHPSRLTANGWRQRGSKLPEPARQKYR